MLCFERLDGAGVLSGPTGAGGEATSCSPRGPGVCLQDAPRPLASLRRAHPEHHARQAQPGKYPTLRPRRVGLCPQRQHRGFGGPPRSSGSPLRRDRLRAVLRPAPVPRTGSPRRSRRHPDGGRLDPRQPRVHQPELPSGRRGAPLRPPVPGLRRSLYVRKLGAGEDLQGTSSYGTRAETSDHHGAILFTSEKLDVTLSWEELMSGTLAVAHHDLQLELHHL